MSACDRLACVQRRAAVPLRAARARSSTRIRVHSPIAATSFLGTTPVSVTYYAGPLATDQRQETLGLYFQDQWNVSRVTLNLGVRYDYLNGVVRDQHMPAGARSFRRAISRP